MNVKEHKLRTIFWECTLRCNIQCLHCGSDCKSDPASRDMPVKDFLRVIDSVTPHIDPNKVLIVFTGGEPLLRKDLETCGRALYQKGYPWGTVTNALFLSRTRLDSLLAAGMHTMTISLDGFEGAHNWLRGHPDSFAKAVKAIKMLTEEKELVWDVVTCVNQKNWDQLEDFKSFLIQMGVKSWRIFTIFPVGRAAQSPHLQLSDEQFTQLMAFIKKTRKQKQIDLNYGCEGFLGGYETEVRDNFFACQAGVGVASVLADGSISACPSIRANFHQGNIYSDDFMTVWNHRFEKFRNRDWARKDACAPCNMFRYCLGNGMHLRDEDEKLLVCHYRRLLK